MPKAPRNWKYIFAQSTYITAIWAWFMILAGKAAEPVLVASVLYASVKLLPIVHFPPQFDVMVFIAQFVALDIGGLSLNKLADQAKKEGNEEGAIQARRLSLALVVVMLIGVIMAGVDQIVKLDGQVGMVIDTILLIARAVMAVLYSRVIHGLRDDENELEPTYSDEEIRALITEATTGILSDAIIAMHQGIVTQLEASLSQRLDERLTMLDMKQADALARFKVEQTNAINETTETIMATVEMVLRKRAARETRDTSVPSSKVRSIADAPSHRTAERDIDKIIWPLLNSGLTVRAIAERAGISTATVGRSLKRWDAAQSVAASQTETDQEVLVTNS